MIFLSQKYPNQPKLQNDRAILKLFKRTFSDSLYYHCHIKVCPKNEETTCSKKDMANVENTCTAPTYYSAAQAASSGTQRKRRDNIITRRQSGSFSGQWHNDNPLHNDDSLRNNNSEHTADTLRNDDS